MSKEYHTFKRGREKKYSTIIVDYCCRYYLVLASNAIATPQTEPFEPPDGVQVFTLEYIFKS